MKLLRSKTILCLAAFLAATPAAWAQRAPQVQPSPHVGYVYPAGGKQGAALEVTVGGQFLDGVRDVHFSGGGVQVTVGKYAKPLTPQQVNRLREKLQEARKRIGEQSKGGAQRGPRGDYASFMKLAKEMGISEEDLKAFAEFNKRRNDPKRQINPQIAETVVLSIKLAADAAPGQRELRLMTPSGLSNPLRFCVGQLPEYRESEPNDKTPDHMIQDALPAVINGQILPGDVDRFALKLHKGTRLVVAAAARELVPYLADAVPGWFQATLSLCDAEGNEVAYADGNRFYPDPVLYCEVPADGAYVLEIKDALYRGREDFVYRITLGELPYVTGIFPLGGHDGAATTVDVQGWNLPAERLTLTEESKGPGIHLVSMRSDQRDSNRVPFAVDTLPECLEKQSGDATGPQPVQLPVILNGRIGQPGAAHVFRFEGHAGEEIVAEVYARRLNSPLDSLLRLTDAAGGQLACNDDHEDKGSGLNTHHADSYLRTTLPAAGVYFLHLTDAQQKGGAEYAYRLRISPPQPDFELRVVPASITARAGMTVPITVYALRKDGFAADIALELQDAPAGFSLSGGWVPATQDQVRLTLTVPAMATEKPMGLHLAGRATIDGRQVLRPAAAAEDMLQAFAYHHLVPAQQWMAAVVGRSFSRGAAMKLLGETPVKLPADGTARVLFSVPMVPFMNQIQLALSEPPDGITIEKSSPTRDGVAIVLHSDPAKVKAGAKGNLIVEAFVERTLSSGDGKRSEKRRFPLGPLPAVPFEVVGR